MGRVAARGRRIGNLHVGQITLSCLTEVGPVDGDVDGGSGGEGVRPHRDLPDSKARRCGDDSRIADNSDTSQGSHDSGDVNGVSAGCGDVEAEDVVLSDVSGNGRWLEKRRDGL